MSWRTVLHAAVIMVVSFAWGHAVHKLGDRLFMPEHVVVYLIFVALTCFVGGCVLGLAWSKLTWPRRRRELRRQWGMDE